MSFSADDASPDTAVISLDNGIELAWESLKYEIKVGLEKTSSE